MAKCQETAGFLISAACSDSAEFRCEKCGKPICARHARDTLRVSAKLCITCYRQLNTYGQSNDDPYLYSGAHHPEYYAYAAAGAAAGIAALSAAQNWSRDRAAFTAENQEDWTDDGWENDYDGS